MGKRFANVLYDGSQYWIHHKSFNSGTVYTILEKKHFEDMTCSKKDLVKFVKEYGNKDIPASVVVKDETNHFALFSLYCFDGNPAKSNFGAIYLSKEGFIFKSIKLLEVWNKTENDNDYKKYFLAEKSDGDWVVFFFNKYQYTPSDPVTNFIYLGPIYPGECDSFEKMKSFLKRKRIVNLSDEESKDTTSQEYKLTDLTKTEDFDTDIPFGLSIQDMDTIKFIDNFLRDTSITPNNIQSLEPNEVFVFGSNLQGQHGGGAARLAYEKFGAVWGLGVGLAGQTYAIPTMHGDIKAIKPYVDQFIETARIMRDKKFLVTKVGCGIAGFSVSQIAPLFKDALELDNVALPQEFVDIIKQTTDL